MRRFGIAVGCTAYGLIALAIMLVSALAFAAGGPPEPAVDPALDWIVKVALALLLGALALLAVEAAARRR